MMHVAGTPVPIRQVEQVRMRGKIQDRVRFQLGIWPF